MAIGTSLGAYFEDEFHHQAGMDTPPEVVKPADTGDDNVVPPSIPDPPNPDAVTRASGDIPSTHITIHPDTPVPDNKALQDIEDIRKPDIVDKLLGTNGAERYQLWPERMIRDMMTSAHDVGAGDVPMWSMDQSTGEMHTSIEGIEHAQSLMPAANGGGFPLRVQLHPQAVEALHEGPDVFRQFMATRGNRQPSNITEQPHAPVSMEQEPFDAGNHITRGRHPDSLPDNEFYEWGEYQHENSMTPTQEHRWLALDEEAGRFLGRSDRPTWRSEESAYQDHLDESFREEAEHRQTVSKRRIEEAKAQFENNPDVVKKGNVSLVSDQKMNAGTLGREYNRHYYNFMSDKGIPGELTVDLSRSRTIHVAWIGTIGSRGPMEVGKSEMKNLFKLLADQYPDAREITGFRVSGARAATGRIGDAAMKIPGR